MLKIKIASAYKRLLQKINSTTSETVPGPNVYFNTSVDNNPIGLIMFKVKCKNISWKIKN
jgi:hypothetical protein